MEVGFEGEKVVAVVAMEQVVGAREEVYDWFNLQIFFAGENSSSKGGKIFERFNRRGLKYILHSSCNWGSASM